MLRIFYAELSRFLKSKYLYIFLAISALVGAFCGIGYFKSIYSLVPVFSVTAAVGLILTPEFTDGGLRNKIIAGHKKGSIYAVEAGICLLLSLVYSLIFFIGFLISSKISGIEFYGNSIILFCLSLVVSTTVFAMIFSALNMLISNKVLAPIISFMIIVLMLGLGMLVDEQLSYDEFFVQMELVQFPDGSFDYKEVLIPNELYIGGAARHLLTVFDCINPYSHASEIFSVIQMNFNEFYTAKDLEEAAAALSYNPLWTLILGAFMTLIGYVIFKRRDIK